ncbi:glycosyltransferase [Rathayibacter sp. AY1C5]|uniref:glycosyltransferase n=1 Tax=Rathayibacter sp. AY1C5 TaxID=2080538 RepID=UPI000CE735A2|nr:glycosyltransferase [Rathayibacter sp. AY1C5]PPG61822.1 hypothetical protein C5C57_02050 [Rathayibacter sp. AY1C5]
MSGPLIFPQKADGVSPEVSVVVPTYDRPDELRRTLTTLAQQEASFTYEVIVADDGSSSDTVAVVKAFEHAIDISYTRQRDDGFRLSAVRNLGARASRGRTLIFLDCGTLAGENLIQSHAANVEVGKRSTAGPTYGWDFSGEDAHAFRSLVSGPDWRTRHMEMATRPGYADYRSDKWLDVDVRRVPLAVSWRFYWGRNIAVARSNFFSAGGFDERFSTYGVEDVEFGYRLCRMGLSLHWIEDAWGVELPSISENTAEQARSNRANLEQWADRCVDMEIEFFICNRPLAQLEQPEWERVARWARDSTNSRADLQILRQHPNDTSMLFVGLMSEVAHSRSVVALGPGFPIASEHPSGWSTARRPVNLNAIGIRCGFAEREFDMVYLSDAMAPLAAVWGEHLLATARRCGKDLLLGRGLAATFQSAGIGSDGF